MPKLQVDGKLVAEIGDDLAGELLTAAKVGTGKEVERPSPFNLSIVDPFIKPTRPRVAACINLTFPAEA